MGDDWQSQKFRQNVISKIECIPSNGQDPIKNATVMENHIFRKARNKDEYLGLVAKLFMHYKDLSQRKPQQPPPNADMGQQNMMQDPLNALQNLASQGNRNPQMMPMSGGPNPNQMSGPSGGVPASNLLQTLNQQRPGQQMQQMANIRGPSPHTIAGGPGGQQQMQVQQMGGAGPGGPVGMQMMGNAGGPGPGGSGGAPGGGASASGIGGQQSQMVGNAQQMGGMPNQMNASGPSGVPVSSAGGPGGGVNVSAGGPGGPNQMQLNSNQMQGGPMNVNAMNVQQMQQMQQNQIQMGMNHPQMNQMMNARMNQGNAMNVGGPNAPPQSMQGMPTNMQQQQQQQQGGPIQPHNVVGGPQGQQQVGNAGMPTNAVQQGNINPMLNMANNMQQKPNMPMGQSGQMFPVNRGGVVGQQQQQPFMRSSPSPADAQMQQQQQQQQLQQLQQQAQQQQQQMVSGNQPQPQQQPQAPQLPTPQMIPSPALVPTSSPQMTNLMQQNSQRNIRQQSPSASINTPGQVTANSPFNPQEEQLYREKYKQLTKYIEPLKRMVTKISNDGTNAEKITKMSKLLEILSTPTQRVPLETLLKCEKALEKLDLASYSGHQFGKSTNPLLEVVTATLQSPLANHTLHRTFRPSLELLFGTDICSPVSAAKRRRLEEASSPLDQEIPHVLQGEIARLDQKFKIKLDTNVQSNNKSIKLICCLDDKRLPSVPPVSVSIPEEYPWVSPECTVAEQEYMTTPFLKSVQVALNARIAKLPKMYSLSHLLDTWEMSVRQACSPYDKPVCEFRTLLGC